MRIRNWYNTNKETLTEVFLLVAFALLPACFILIGIRADNVLDKSLSLFVGAGLAIPMIIIVASIVKSRQRGKG